MLIGLVGTVGDTVPGAADVFCTGYLHEYQCQGLACCVEFDGFDQFQRRMKPCPVRTLVFEVLLDPFSKVLRLAHVVFFTWELNVVCVALQDGRLGKKDVQSPCQAHDEPANSPAHVPSNAWQG